MVAFQNIFFLCFLDQNAFKLLYYTATGRPDVFVVCGIIRPKLEPHLFRAHCSKKIFHEKNRIIDTIFFFFFFSKAVSVSRDQPHKMRDTDSDQFPRYDYSRHT